jgi:nuclear pore complex protein Nup188
LIPLIQTLTSIISVAILNPQQVFSDFDNGSFNEWNAASYVLDGSVLEQLTQCLANSMDLGPTPVLPAIFAWASIVWRLMMHVRFVDEDRERQLESAAPGSRMSLPAPSQLEEAVLHMSRFDANEPALYVRLAEACILHEVLDVMAVLFRPGMIALGSSIDRVSRDKLRLLYVQVVRAAMDADAIDFSQDGLVDLVHQILVGERTAHNWSAYDAPRQIDDPVVTFVRADHVLREKLLKTAQIYYPFQVEPLLLFSSALIRGEGPKENGEPTAYDDLIQMGTVTQRMPIGFVDYRLEQEDTNENRVALAVDLPQFTKSSTSSFSTQHRLLAPDSAPRLEAFMLIDADTPGIILDDTTQPYVTRWRYPHSALEYLYHLLSTFAVGSTKVVYATQEPVSATDAAKIIELFADIMHSSLKTSRAQGAGNNCSVDVLTALSIGAEYSPDTVSVVLTVFEEQLLRLYQEPSNDSSLQLLVACTHFLQALIEVAPNRVWPWLARSRLLQSDGTGGSLASILIGTEMVLGSYKFLIGCIRLFQALAVDAVGRSVSRKSPHSNRVLTRFNASITSDSGTSEKSMSSTLLVFGKMLASIYETSLGWKYDSPEDRLHINTGICEAFSFILKVAYSIDDAPELGQKLTNIIAPIASYITDLYLAGSRNDLPTNPILSSLLSGTDLLKNTTLTSGAALSKRQTQSTLQFSEILVRVAILLERPWTHLEQQLFKATPLLARLYVTSEVWKSPVVTLLEILVRGAVRVVEDQSQENKGLALKQEHNEPPSLLGHLGPKTAKNFMLVLSQLDEPLKITDIQKSVWHLLTAVVTCKQRWFALYLLTGNTPREMVKSKSKTNSQAPTSKSLLSRAFDSLSHLDLNRQNPPWHLWTAMLEFITSAQNHWSWAMGDLRERKEFIQQLIGFLKWISNQPPPRAEEAVELRSMENKFASLAAEILAMHLHTARQLGDVASVKDVLGTLTYYQEEALRLPPYNVALHMNLQKNIEEKFPGVKLANFKRTTMQPSSYGSGFFYDIEIASSLLDFHGKWLGPKLGQGFKAEVERANRNLSLVDSHVKLLHSWRLLTLELSHFATKDPRITTCLIQVTNQCMKANADSSLPEALFGQLIILRADLAFALLKRLVQDNVRSGKARQLLGTVWAAVRAAVADFDNVFSSEEVDYYRTLLRILYLTLHFYLIDPSDKVDPKEASFRSSFRGTIVQPKNKDEAPINISLELLEILSDTVAKGFRSLATQLHNESSSVSPSDFALLTALVQRIIAIPEMATSHSQITLLFANSNTVRYASSLFSWSDRLTLDIHSNSSGTASDPIYGELSLLFILSLSSVRGLAESMAVEGVLSRLNNANLMNYFRRPGGMGPFDTPVRMHSIWTKGILPLCLNLLLSVGAPITAEISSFLNAFPEQLQRSSNALNTRYVGKITLNLASEMHSLALISSIIDAVKAAGVREGVQPGDVAPLEWDKENVKEDIEGWVGRMGALRERVVGDGTQAYEDKVVAEIEAAGVCLGLGKSGL